MRVIITCGAGCEPIDQVRFISNTSTGELGALLAKELKTAGFEVICLRSRLATYPIDSSSATVVPFTTNIELLHALEELSRQERRVRAFFHAAALCDYRVEKITTARGEEETWGKIPTQLGMLQMTLHPTVKVIATLRALFPQSLLVGWKYEVDGTQEEAITKAEHQIEKYQLDASVANGPIFKKGFEFIPVVGPRKHLASKGSLTSFLARWIASR